MPDFKKMRVEDDRSVKGRAIVFGKKRNIAKLIGSCM
jgi:hypothetical protein